MMSTMFLLSPGHGDDAAGLAEAIASLPCNQGNLAKVPSCFVTQDGISGYNYAQVHSIPGFTAISMGGADVWALGSLSLPLCHQAAERRANGIGAGSDENVWELASSIMMDIPLRPDCASSGQALPTPADVTPVPGEHGSGSKSIRRPLLTRRWMPCVEFLPSFITNLL